MASSAIGSFIIGVSAIGSTGIPLGYQQITDLSASIPLVIPNGTITATVIAEGAAIRYLNDGTDPTPSMGMPLAAGVTLYCTGDLSALRFIGQAPRAILNVLYFGAA